MNEAGPESKQPRILALLLRPSLVGRRFLAESALTTTLRFILAATCIWTVLILLFSWENLPSPRRHALLSPGVWAAAIAQTFGPLHASQLGLLYFAAFFGCLALCGLAAWLWLCDLHRCGLLRIAYVRAFRLATIGLWPLLFLLSFCGTVFLFFATMEPGEDPYAPLILAGITTAISAVFCLGMLITWAGRVIRSVLVEPPALSTLCEGCGYDLSHEPAGGLCSECGLDLAVSLQEGKRRIASAWEAAPGVLTWLRTFASIIFRPRSFYARLRLRDGGPEARRFAIVCYLVMAPCAAAWIFAIMVRVIRAPPPADEGGWWFGAFVVFALTSGIVLAGWGIKRLVAATETTLWFLGGWLRDGRWAAKVVAYETAYLSVFCAFDGLLFTSFAISSRWPLDLQERILGHRANLFVMPLDALLLWFGNLAFIVLWLLRYRTILRAIRWSNF